MSTGGISSLHSQESSRCIFHILNVPRGRRQENRSCVWHSKCRRLACYVSLASPRFSFSVARLPSTPLSAAAAAAAATNCTLVKLAPFPTVLLSALEHSPFGTAGCHGAGSILPTGAVLERGELSACQEMSGHEKVQSSLVNKNTECLHLESKVGQDGGGVVCYVFPF